MFKQMFALLGAIIATLIALYLFLHGSFVVGALFLIAAGKTIYKNFFAAPVALSPVLTTKFEDIKNTVTQHGATGIFVGKISELEKSQKWNAFAAEVIQAQSQLLNAAPDRMFTGNAVVDVGVNVAMKAGINQAVLAGTDVLVAQFNDGTHLSATLPYGVNSEVADFLNSAKAAGVPVEGDIKKTPMIGGPYILALVLVVALVVGIAVFASFSK